MTGPPDAPILRALGHELESIRSNWLWFVLLGVGLIVLGMVALGSPVVASLATAMALGALFLVSGLFELVGAFWARHWSGTLVVLLSGVLSAVLGFMMLNHPAQGSLALTVLIAAFLFVGGTFKIAAALSHRIGAWLWIALGGAVDVLLAILIWTGFPATGFVVLGVLVGIALIFRGLTWLMIGLTVRKLPSSRSRAT